jgi:uncharacterized caspase-like protein
VRTWIQPLLIAAAAALCFSESAFAEKRVALVVANSSYVNATLPNPKFDAALIKASLEKAGFEVTVRPDVRVDAFEEAILQFAEAASGADVALFYYVGHGFSTGDKSGSHWLFAVDTDFAAKTELALHSKAESLEHIEENILGKAKNTLIFVDACRNSLAPAQGRGNSQRGFQPFDPADSAFFVVSTRAGKTTADGAPGNGSPFARAFASILPTPGLRIYDVYRRIRDAVSEETAGEQLPDLIRNDLPDATITLVKRASGGAEVDAAGSGAVTNERLVEAREEWEYLQFSNNPDALKSFASDYKDTEFAALAAARATTISPPSADSVEQNTIKMAERGRPAGAEAVTSLPDQGIRAALVIGMSKYEAVSTLTNPDRDAEGVAEALKAIGFKSVTLVEDVSRSKLVKALRDFQEVADHADWALVYYAGHGIEIKGENYLIPVDAQLATDRDVEDETVSLNTVRARIRSAHRLQLVILDACRNNPFLLTMKRADGTRGIDHRGLAPVEPDPNEIVVYAARDGEAADDGQNTDHSPFSAALIARLKEPRIEIHQVFRNVTKDVYEATNGTQRPFVYGDSFEDFYFNVSSP